MSHGLHKPATILLPLPDNVIDELVCQALAGSRNATAREQIRMLVRLVEAELQGRLAEREYKRRRLPKVGEFLARNCAGSAPDAL